MGLRAYKTFQDHLRGGHYPEQMGFKTRAGAINRLNARVRLAAAYRGLKLEDYSDETADGYESLMRVFLAHSALERLMYVLGYGSDVGKLESASEELGGNEVVDRVRKLDEDKKLFRFIEAELRGKTKKEKAQKERQNRYILADLDRYFGGTLTNVAALSQMLRHIFVHGSLSAGANGVASARLSKICESVSDFLLALIDEEFSRVVEAYDEKLAAAA